MNNRGFSLIEVLIAVLIAAFLLAAVWSSFLLGNFNVKCARHTAQAVDVCEAGVELMLAKNDAQLQALLGQKIVEDLDLDFSDDKTASIGCTRTTTISDADADNVYEVTVTVDWTERYLGGTKPRNVVINTQIGQLTK